MLDQPIKNLVVILKTYADDLGASEGEAPAISGFSGDVDCCAEFGSKGLVPL